VTGATAPLRILFQDSQLAALDKPPGLLVIPGRGTAEPTLRAIAEAELGRLWVIHRLDRGTSGLVLFARSAGAHRTMNLAFDNREVAKRYLALVRIAPGSDPGERRIDLPLVPGRRGRMRPARPGDQGAKEAATRIRTLERWGDLALVEALPETGRTHQIRVHLAAVGCPLAVDPEYGSAEPLRDTSGKVLLDRTPLHAAELRLMHPMTKTLLTLQSPLAPDIEATLVHFRATITGT
jgi:tRNA pseudouridine32 synthase/23S rRNA pseudouridine746 synthase